LRYNKIKWEKICWICDICFVEFPIETNGFYCETCKDFYVCVSCYVKKEREQKPIKNQNIKKSQSKDIGLFVIQEKDEETINELKDNKRNSNNIIKNIDSVKEKVKNGDNNSHPIKPQRCCNCCVSRKICLWILLLIVSLIFITGAFYLTTTILSYIKSKK
jgi:hypothetical protein